MATGRTGRGRTELSDELRHELFGRRSFMPVLVLTLLSLVAFPFTDRYHWGFLVTMPLIATTVLAAFDRSQVSRRFLRVATLVIVLAAVLSLVTAAAAAAGPGDGYRLVTAISASLMGGLVLVALPAITREAFRHERVTINTLAAAVVAYLFIGFLFTSVYRLIAVIWDVPFFAQVADPEVGDYQYFSFIALTTTGFGDLSAATDVGRAAVVLEVVAGQVFLVTAVARIVSLLGQRRHETALVEDDDYYC